MPRESAHRETRVALVPETVARLGRTGFEITVETGAGTLAGFPDDAYRDAGATIAEGFALAVHAAEVTLKVQPPTADEARQLPAGSVLIGFLGRGADAAMVEVLIERRLSAFAMEMVPRISRAQKMDALSSMASIAGYRAVLLAATRIGRFFPLLMTAAGTIPPARVFVLGAGVAGLQAIATARRLGAVVEAFDVRPAVREEVQSLGATFVGPELLGEHGVGAGGYAKELDAGHQNAERQLIQSRLPATDVVITTASIPGKPAPLLITDAMVAHLKPGSVIVDLAADSGGNCELTQPGHEHTRHGVHVLGPLNVAAGLPTHASQMFARNVSAVLVHLAKDGKLQLDFDDEIMRGMCLTHAGQRGVEPLAAGKGA